MHCFHRVSRVCPKRGFLRYLAQFVVPSVFEKGWESASEVKGAEVHP